MTTLVAAIIALATRLRNEFNALYNGAKKVFMAQRLDDGATGKTYAVIANEINTAVADAILAIKDGASTTGDTLKKLEDRIVAIVGGSYATEAFVQQKINDLINGAPGLIDTFQEVADALGNDPNFATSILNLLAQKANITDVYSKIESDNFFVLKTDIGDTNHNFVADFEDGLLP